MQNKQDESFGIIPVFKKENGDFLFCIVEHGYGDHFGFPKGHKDEGESDFECAKRELFEETGIKDIDIIPGAEFTQEYEFELEDVKYEKTVKFFVGFVDNIEVRTQEKFQKEIKEIKWLPYEELLEQISFDSNKDLAKRVYKYLKDNM